MKQPDYIGIEEDVDAKKRSTWLVKDMSPDDKPREKALANGIETLSSTELLAIIFGSGMKGKSVVDLSREILSGVENRLDRLAQMSIQSLSSRYAGIGPAKAISLAAAIELGRRCQREIETNRDKDVAITGSDSIYREMRHNVENLQHEEFWAVYLSRSNKIIGKERISKGGVAMTVVDVKIILKSALDRLASGVVLVHNHPSGNKMPSVQDDNITNRVKEASKLLDINMLDHLIITSSGYFSYHDEGRLN
ncbi:MAG: DNA repair protein RadC [Muribaculaceae bacterium]|nr:DNA repair protein RadC [Muribaculaceae bacterium]MDE5858487.1 DNA repair protein RadC [Muribaculaceae bacterium]